MTTHSCCASTTTPAMRLPPTMAAAPTVTITQHSTAAYTGWYHINTSWDQDYYDTYASVNVYKSRFPTTTRIIVPRSHHRAYYRP